MLKEVCRKSITVSAKFQVVIPHDLRRLHNIQPGQKLEATETLIMPIQLPASAAHDNGSDHQEDPGKTEPEITWSMPAR